MSVPRISVVIVTDQYRTIRRVLDHLSRQTARSDIELIVVVPRDARSSSDESGITGFASVKFVELESVHPVPRARAAGIRAATAPVIFLGETHSFPGPELAEALISAHENSWDAVVPGLTNANPASAWSWASYLMDYGTWDSSNTAGEIHGAPTWNVAYRKDLLEQFDDNLEGGMAHGDTLAVWLRDRNARMYFEPRAQLAHANVERFRNWVEQRFLAGVLVAASRRGRWSTGRLMMYVFASPLIPAVILYRLRSTVVARLRDRAMPAAAVPALVLGTLFRTAGEVAGYVRGARPAEQPRMDHYEIQKLAFTSISL
ncbi:MAG TPA: glycosyltransferase [Gemmatimonadaceae bacterium]